MATSSQAKASSPVLAHEPKLHAWSSTRLFVAAGIALMLAGMLFGDIYAVFILHQDAGRIGGQLLAAVQAVAQHDSAAVNAHFAAIGGLLENRGTKVDAHSHMIAFGYVAFLLAIAQPFVALGERAKIRLARLFVLGAVMLPISVFLIHYVGLAFSPLAFIGWASIFADLGGLIVAVACVGELIGIRRHFATATSATGTPLSPWTPASRLLLAGGVMLILIGFLHGVWYASVSLYEHEARETTLLNRMLDGAASAQMPAASQAVSAYGLLQGEKAVAIAAHSHIIEFGIMAALLAFLQPYIFLTERWKQRWARVLLLGSLLLPIFVQLEIKWGLIAGGIADFGGLLVVVALAAMFVGVMRHTGHLDAQAGGAS